MRPTVQAVNACTAPRSTEGWRWIMNGIRIYPGRDGWFYEVWIASRLVIFGWSETRERAERRASGV